MNRRIAAAVILAAASLLLMGPDPRSQYRAASVKFADGEFLQAKHDRRCSEFFLEGDTATTETTTGVAVQVYETVSFADANMTLTQIGTDWSAGTADKIEMVYAPTDTLGGNFVCQWARNEYHSYNTATSPQAINTSLGIASGGACSNGDQLMTTYVASGIMEIWMTTTGANRIVLADGDRLCLMMTTAGTGTIDSESTGFTLECKEQSVSGAGTSCYH